MHQTWATLTFLHWRYDIDTVQRLLPEGLTVESHDGAAWVGLVPLHMTVRGPVGPPVPWASYFPETNVRTYVTGPGGRTGVWFFSLDASRLGAVATARATFGLPYFWARMDVARDGDTVRYTSTRRPPGPPARSDVEVEIGAPYDAAGLTALDHYLTARFLLWAKGPTGRLLSVRAYHPPWPLRRATVRRLDTGLVTAARLPEPDGDPRVHFSDGVDVVIGAPSA